MRVVPTFIVSVTLLLSACGQAKLTDSNAVAQIKMSSVFSRYAHNIPLIHGWQKEAIEQGVLNNDNGDALKVSKNANKYLLGISQEVASFAEALRISINIENKVYTDDYAEIDFKWSYKDLPKYVRRYASAGGDGRATFARSDNGWLLREVEMKPLTERYAISQDVRNQIGKDIQSELERKRILKDRLDECRAPTKIRYEVQFTEGSKKSGLVPRKQKVVVTNTDIQYIDGAGNIAHEWLGHFRGVQLREDQQYMGDITYRFIFAAGPKPAGINWTMSIYDPLPPFDAAKMENELRSAVSKWNEKCGSLPFGASFRYAVDPSQQRIIH